jgi:hypothetical protein
MAIDCAEDAMHDLEENGFQDGLDDFVVAFENELNRRELKSLSGKTGGGND